MIAIGESAQTESRTASERSPHRSHLPQTQEHPGRERHHTDVDDVQMADVRDMERRESVRDRGEERQNSRPRSALADALQDVQREAIHGERCERSSR